MNLTANNICFSSDEAKIEDTKGSAIK